MRHSDVFRWPMIPLLVFALLPLTPLRSRLQAQEQPMPFLDMEDVRTTIFGHDARPAPSGRRAAPAPVTGNKPWIMILVRFSDSTDYTPQPKEYFEELMGNEFPGLDHYWREQSYGALTTAGSKVAGWYNLPHPKSYYAPTTAVCQEGCNLLWQDAVALATADPGRTWRFPDFYGIGIIVNDDRSCPCGGCGGGPGWATLDGVGKAWAGVTIWSPQNLYVIVHETGHGFLLPHSQVYD